MKFLRAAMFAALLPVSACSGASGSAIAPVAHAVSAPPSAPATLSSAPPATGTVTIAIPTAPPILCTPASITLQAGTQQTVTCSARGYIGSIAATVQDLAVATVTPLAGSSTMYIVSGIGPGTTTLSLSDPSGGAGTLAIEVTAP